MSKYKVFLDYIKDFEVEADSYEEAIRKAHKGDCISEGSFTACDENDYADLIEEDKLLIFNTISDLRANAKMQRLGKYEHKRVLLNGKEVIACGTDLPYEDILYGKSHEMLDELFNKFRIDDPDSSYKTELSTAIRDYILEYLENDNKAIFVDVCEEY